MRARQSGRMRADKGDVVHAIDTGQRDLPIGRRTQPDRTFGQPGQQLQTRSECFGIARHHDGRIRRQRPGVDGRDKNRAGNAVRSRHPAERPRAERGPQARAQQALGYLAAIKRL